MEGTVGLPSLRHTRAAVIVALVVAVSATAVAVGADERPVDLPDVRALAARGDAVEEFLAGVGLDAAWRSSVDLHPGARALAVEYPRGGDTAVAALLTTALELDGVTRERERVVSELRTTAVDLAAAREDEREREIDRNRAEAHYQGMAALAQAAAIQVFSGSDPATEALLGLDGEALLIAQRDWELTNYTMDELFDLRTEAQLALDAAIEALDAAIETRERIEERHAELTEQATELAHDRRELDDGARSLLPAAAEAFALAAVPGQAALTPRALSAYLEAEDVMHDLAPGCGISWRTLAAVGAVEGAHGQYGGRRLGIDGRPDEAIVGLRLDGSTVDNLGQTVANLSDTDGGRYDGDPLHDRAVGPMQFIPQTWATWGRDGDGDGTAEPQDIDDAALAAGAYLCNYGSLRSWDGWIRAIFGYNHAAAYVNSIHGSLMNVNRLRLPSFEGDERLQPPTPGGTFVPLPIPVPEEPTPEEPAPEGQPAPAPPAPPAEAVQVSEPAAG
jgi:hypothetical protein